MLRRCPRLPVDQAPLLLLLRLLSCHVVVGDVADGGGVGLDALDLGVVGDLGELALGGLKLGVVLHLRTFLECRRC